MAFISLIRQTYSNFSVKHLETLIRYAQDMLGLPVSDIISRFSDCPFGIIEYHESDKKVDGIEIRFDAEQTDVLCHLDDNRICMSVYIFPNNFSTPRESVRYLNSTYIHDYEKCRWKLPGGILLLERDEKENIYFYVLIRAVNTL